MTKDTKVMKTRVEGDVYLSSTGEYYVAPEVTPQKILDLSDNVYARGLMMKQRNMLFSDKFALEVTDPSGNQDEKLELSMMRMCDAPDVALWAKIQMAWVDEFRFGCSINNEVWDWVENEYTLLKLRHLPAHSFGVMPFNAQEAVYCQLLPGIILGKNGEIEFWQTSADFEEPIQIKSATIYKNPTSDEIGGTSILLPLIPIINMLGYTWKTQMQQVNRVGAKLLFLKITDPMPASGLNEGVSDLEAGRLILKYWGKNNSFPLRGNMELIDPKIKDDANNLEVVEALNQMLIDYTTSIDLLSQGNDGARIGGSDVQRMLMILRNIKSVYIGLEDWASAILQRFLDVNGYDDYIVRLKIPAPEIDTSEIDIQRAAEGRSGKVLGANELRALLGQEELTDEELEEIADFWASHVPAMPFGAQLPGGVDGDDDDAKRKKEKEEKNKAESALKATSATNTSINIAAAEIISVGRKLADDLIDAMEKEDEESN